MIPANRPDAVPGVGFPRGARLLSAADYQQVFRRHRRYANDAWLLLVHRKQGGGDARVGLAIAKKKARRSVDRSRLKRVVRESFRHQRSYLTGLDIVVMNTPLSASLPRSALRERLDALWREIAAGSPPSSRRRESP